MKLILVLDNIRSCYNVGAILRSAEGFGAEKVILSGYTPRVHDANLLPHLRDKLDREIHKTALGAEEMLDIYACDDIKNKLFELKSQGWQVVGLENNIETDRIFKLNGSELKNKITDKIVLVLGEEVNGIDNSLYDIIDLFVEIPMRGQKESFNVSVAAGIAMYGIMSL
ncbi:TrmH family RNA methyltransferase [Candidatus Saccharibacteria bacterium]|nr:TrmH family RNA methyltransferase [Candidatus Saccharibacteria bacterium]